MTAARCNDEDSNSSTDVPEAPGSEGRQALPSANDRIVVNSACIACRSKHLKCDGLRICSRCASQGVDCVYLRSRRGYRGSGARGRHSGPASQNVVPQHNRQLSCTLEPSNGDHISLPEATSMTTFESSSGGIFMSTYLASNSPGLAASDGRNCQRCVEAFYQYFYGAHPFLPPRQQFLQMLKERPMDHLLTAMCFIGSRYVAGLSTNAYAMDIESFILSPPVEDASVVQTLLLYALGLEGSGEKTKAIEILLKAQQLALRIGMNRREYSIANGQNSTIREESLRRSWHELYVVCVMTAGFHGRRPFHYQEVKSSVPLPCEARYFEIGLIPSLHTLEEFNEDGFNDEEIDWSSYAYRIAAAHNLDKIIRSVDTQFPDDSSMHRLETHLTTWKLHLPESKKACFDETGKFDEMLFQAHMIHDVSSILLHRHYSKLDGLAVQTITSCSEQIDLAPFVDNLHTIKTAQSATDVSRLVSLPTPLINHTHFFVCALTLSSIVHLSRWSALPVISLEQDLKERIRMNAGALKAMANVWYSARMGFGQVTKAGRMIYATRKDAAGDAFWSDFMQDDIMTGLIEDDTYSDSLLESTTLALP